MPSNGSKRLVWFFLLTAAASLSLLACTPTQRRVPPQASPVRLQDPTTTHTDSATLTVGTNRWSHSATILEEAFLPLAVTMRNTSSRPLCGGVQTAALHTTDGSSLSAVVPTTVVERLFGPIASVEPEVPLGTVRTAPRATSCPPARPWSSWRPLSRGWHAEWRSLSLCSTAVLFSFLVTVLLSAGVSFFRALRFTVSCSFLSSPSLALSFALLVIRLSVCFTLLLALLFTLLFAVFPILRGPLLSLLALFPL